MGSFFCKLDNRGVIRLGGKDRFDFFQGLITQDIFLLRSQPVLYTALLSPQGRYLFDFFILAQGDDFYIITTRAEDLLKRLKMYKLRRDVSLEIAPMYVYVGHEMQMEALQYTFTDPRIQHGLLWGISETLIETAPTEEMAYHAHRIHHGLPESDVDMLVDKTFPLEAGLHELNGISFTKGCYVGQELTTRTYHRGTIRKRLIPVKLHVVVDTSTFSPGPIMQGDEEVGDVRSIVTYNDQSIAMAMLRLEALETDDDLMWRDIKITPLSSIFYC